MANQKFIRDLVILILILVVAVETSNAQRAFHKANNFTAPRGSISDDQNLSSRKPAKPGQWNSSEKDKIKIEQAHPTLNRQQTLECKDTCHVDPKIEGSVYTYNIFTSCSLVYVA